MISKEEALIIITKCAELYKKNLENKKLLFVFKNNHILENQFIEGKFLAGNFTHLTGITNESINIKSSRDFYETCIAHKLTTADFSMSNQTSELKLRVLENIIHIDTNAKMLGEYNNFRPILITEKLVGNINACMGFIQADDNYYVPNTALWEDIRNVTIKPTYKVIAIYKTAIYNDVYSHMTYVAKGIDPYTIKLPKEIMDKLDLQHMQYDFIKSESKPAPEANVNHKGISKEKAIEMLKEACYPPNNKLVKDLVKLGETYSFQSIKELKEICKDVKEIISDFQKIEKEIYHQEPEK